METWNMIRLVFQSCRKKENHSVRGVETLVSYISQNSNKVSALSHTINNTISNGLKTKG